MPLCGEILGVACTLVCTCSAQPSTMLVRTRVGARVAAAVCTRGPHPRPVLTPPCVRTGCRLPGVMLATGVSSASVSLVWPTPTAAPRPWTTRTTSFYLAMPNNGCTTGAWLREPIGVAVGGGGDDTQRALQFNPHPPHTHACAHRPSDARRATTMSTKALSAVSVCESSSQCGAVSEQKTLFASLPSRGGFRLRPWRALWTS
jgi:hypothetical protein